MPSLESVLERSFRATKITKVARRYYNDTNGLDLIRQVNPGALE